MPFSTTSRDTNQGMANAANNIAKAFIGDPKADAEWANQQVKNSTEYQRQRLLSEQVISEGIQRKQMEAAAAASYASAAAANALAGERKQGNKARDDLGNLFTTPVEVPGTPVAIPLEMRAPTRGVDPGVFYGDHGPSQKVMAAPTLDDPRIATQAAAIMLRGGIDPKNAGAMALIPGNSDEALGRIFTAGGHTIGGDQYVSVRDRNMNNTTNVPVGSRMVNNQGHEIVPAAPGAGAGGKVPMLKQSDANSILRSAVLSRGAQIDPEMQVAAYFAAQPELYGDLSHIVSEGWKRNGGNAAAVQDLINQYLGAASFKGFGGRTDNRLNPFSAEHTQVIKPAMTIEQLLGNAEPGVNPGVFTGGQAPLPNLQNVGNGGGWKVIGVQ